MTEESKDLLTEAPAKKPRKSRAKPKPEPLVFADKPVEPEGVEVKPVYYTTDKIEKKKATYNVIFGERSNGKTFALLKKCLKDFFNDGSQMAYVRRWKEDITGRRASQLYAGINEAGVVKELSGGEYHAIHYYAGKWYLCKYDEESGKPIYSDQDIVAFSFALSDTEHDKSTSFPRIGTIVFDEFLSAKYYLPDEFVHFMNTVSTIVRKREDVRVYMLGNTVNKFCPYFKEMGLHKVPTQTQGTIDLYSYGTSKLTVAVEYCSSQKSEKASNKYFAFDNPKLEMITGGAWEMAIYPHLPYKYKPKDVQLTYFIEFNDFTFQCEIVDLDGVWFTFIHPKTTEIKDLDRDLIYSLDYNPKLNYNRNIFKPRNKVQERILWFYTTSRVFFQSNDVGDTVNNFLKCCRG